MNMELQEPVMRSRESKLRFKSNYRTFESDENIFIFACIYKKHLAKSYMKPVTVVLYHQHVGEGQELAFHVCH